MTPEKTGRWKGGTKSWGYHKIRIHANSITNTHGRGGFFIHGGEILNSAGCIDLGSDMGDFVLRLVMHLNLHDPDRKTNIKLTVKYAYMWEYILDLFTPKPEEKKKNKT
jgi:hypothetical protein